MPDGRTAPVGSPPWVAGALEAVGGTLLLFGLFTRPVAFLLSGEMAVAYFHGHAGQGFWPVLNQGTQAVLFASYGCTSRQPAPAWPLDRAIGSRAPQPYGSPAGNPGRDSSYLKPSASAPSRLSRRSRS